MRFPLLSTCVGVALVSPALLASQTAGANLTPAQQIAAATAAAPAELRDGAAVLGYDASKKLVSLRPGKNDMVCLANNPAGEKFHVACYHKLLEPFMARGRELRAQGVKDDQVDTVRFKEITTGKLEDAVHTVGTVHAHRTANELRPGDRQGHGRIVALRGLHSWRDGSVDGHHREAGEGRAVDHVSGDAEGAHHVLHRDVTSAT